ncbi:MAG TPA: helix-turn-helix transcriptional regulator [Ruminiclostridium sp.]|nr:helix-turn-helix transcriptional regulator [Ruminiclostridium sp.]
MDDLKFTIAKNIVELRKSMNLTQAELAQRLNYTDKAVSKWERAESIPDISILKKISEMFGVSVDYLLETDHPKSSENPSWQTRRNRIVITLLCVTFVFMFATFLFTGYGIFSTPLRRLWIIYIYAIPAATIVVLVFNSIWGRNRTVTNCIITSVLIWSVLISAYLSFVHENLWLLFAPGIPAQIFVLLWSKLKFRHK